MRSLFLRIFILCWITNVLVFVSAVVLMTQTTLLPMPPSVSSFLKNHLMVSGQAAESILNHAGPHALDEYLENLKKTAGFSVYILNDLGQEISDRPLPLAAQRMAKRVREGNRLERLAIRREWWVGGPIRGLDGEGLVMVSQLDRIPFADPTWILAAIIPPMITILVTAGLIALLLAYRITLPLTRLRTAAHRLASGDLAARVELTVTKRRDAIGDLGREFDLMASRIESLVSAQRRLLQDVSHELRSPLARLNVALGIASRTAGTPVKEALGRIEHEAEQLNELIGRLLTLSRLESGQYDVERADLDLATMVDEIAVDGSFEAEERRCRVRFIRRESCFVKGVEGLLRSAIENVLRNAIVYTTIGSDVDVEVFQQPQNGELFAVVSVRDRGPGVPKEHLSRIFEPFYRVDDARDRKRGGVGLGLSIAKRAVGFHGGRITASNAPEGGLIVELCIPATTYTSDSADAGPL